MRVFISWSGERSEIIATAFKALLEGVFPEMHEPALSTVIPSGEDWRRHLEKKLDQSQALIICFTPEATTSSWILYEAGYMAAKKDASVHPFVYGADLPDPLANLMAQPLTKEKVKQTMDAIASQAEPAPADVDTKFDEHWPAFDKAIRSLVLLPISDFIRAEQFAKSFDRKTFNESFPDCLDMQWLARYKAVAEARQILDTEETKQALSTDDYVKDAFHELRRQLDRYQMLIGGALLQEVAWDDVPERHRQRLERCRQEIVRLVSDFDKPSHPPIFEEESIAFASADTATRKETVHSFEDRIRNGKIDPERLDGELAASGWDLDRIVRYVEWREKKRKSTLSSRLSAVRREEERARTRGLTRGLQPLYYALEAFDELFPGRRTDRGKAKRLGPEIDETIAAVDRFVNQQDDRDSGGHIARRVRSIRRKLRDVGYDDTDRSGLK